MLASTWFDLVIGIDLHFELVPPPMVPIPFPHPFVGLVVDPIGLAAGLAISNAIGMAFGGSFKGPVLINLLPATTTGTEAKNFIILPHFIIPPGVMWAPMFRVPKPSIIPGKPPSLELPIPPPGDAMVITGSKTVHAMGANLCRLGDIALSCSDPIRLPSSLVLTIPKGAPVLVGGPPAVDWMAAAMALIKCKWIAERLHKLVNRIQNARLRNLLHKGICFLTGHPVDVATGRVLTDGRDFELPGPFPLAFERNYASSWAHRDSTVGHGWSHSLDQAVWIEPGCIVYRAEDGREIEFDTFDLPGRVIRPGEEIFEPLNRLTLRCLGQYRWEIETPDGVVREFAKVPGDEDPKVSRLSRKRTRNGHEISLHYDGRARLAWVRDACGRIVRFEHDEAGRLVLVSLPHPTQPGWVPHTRYVYSREGDLVEVVDPLGHRTRYEYVTHLLVRETDRTGLSFYFGYDGTGSSAYCIRTWGDGGIHDHEIDYDKAGRVTYVTNSLGATTTYEMNVACAVVKVIDPLGGETCYEYDDNLWKTAEIDPLGNAARYSHDARGNITKIVGPDGATLEIAYDARNRPIQAKDPCGGIWQWRNDEQGQLLERMNPNGEVVRYEHRDGLLVAVIDPSGARTSFEYDEMKNVRTVRTPAGLEQTATRDNLGRLLWRRDSRGNVQRRHHDALGRVVTVEQPDGNVLRLAYDAEGYLTETQDHDRHVRLRYGGYHKLVRREEAGQEIRFAYDTEGRLVEVENEIGEVFRFKRDACGRIQAETGFDGRTVSYVRDRAGSVTEVRRPSGARSVMSYDAMGRVTSVRHPDGTSARYAYRADGVLIEAANDATTVRFERDPIGRLLREWQGERWVESRYDARGARIGVSSSLGTHVATPRNILGDVEAVTLSEGAGSWHVDFAYDSTGLEVERRLPGGVVVERSYDQRGRLNAQGVLRAGAELERTTYSVGPGGRLLARSDSRRGAEVFEHDARGRLIAARHADGQVEHRAVDPAGRVYKSPDRSDRRYGPGGELVEAQGVQYIHNADGELLEKVFPDGSRVRFSYHGSGLLKEVERQDGTRVRFEYDGLGRRIRKRAGESVTTWVWDRHAPLHELPDEDAPITWLFDSMGLRPIGKAQGAERYGIVTDQVGAPVTLYDEAGEICWRAQLDVWGVPSGDVARTRCPFRFPGQYEDEETGLYYNRFRYYDPRTGRYTTQDPIGLMGGLDLYGYTADPLRLIDPFGLDGHHTVPVQLMRELEAEGLISKGALDELGKAGYLRPELVNLPRPPAHTQNVHCDVHSALSDYLNDKWGTDLDRGFQRQGVWQEYLAHLEGEGITGKAKLDQVLSDFHDFYHNDLPTTSVLDSLGSGKQTALDGLQKSFDDDASKLKNSCS
jgi:RHS repeat-associated protein